MTSLFLKKLVAVIMSPLTLVVILLAIGVLFLWTERLRPAGRWMTTVALVLLLLSGYGIPSDYLGERLETRYPAVLEVDRYKDLRWIVVLGGGHRAQNNFPPSSQTSNESLYRLVEGIRLHRQIPGSRLVIAGGALFDSVSSARVGADLALALGVEPGAIAMEERPRDTEEEALRIRKTVGDAPFLLVTSAIHMPRAMFYFERMGMHPIPAPTQHRVQAEVGAHPSKFFPSAEKILVANAVAYEMLGMWWASLSARQ